MKKIISVSLMSYCFTCWSQGIDLPTSGVGTQINTIQTLNQVDRKKNETSISFEQQEQEEQRDLGFSYNDEAHRERVRKIKRDESRKANSQNKP